MYDPLTPMMCVAALKQVKEFHIDLIDLSWKMLKDDGKVDDEKMALHQKEISEVADQATGYVEGVRKAVNRIFAFREQTYVVRRNH